MQNLAAVQTAPCAALTVADEAERTKLFKPHLVRILILFKGKGTPISRLSFCALVHCTVHVLRPCSRTLQVIRIAEYESALWPGIAAACDDHAGVQVRFVVQPFAAKYSHWAWH
jgi:hypothetical protein